MTVGATEVRGDADEPVYHLEKRVFRQALPELLKQHRGQFVVIAGSDIEPQTFSTHEKALEWGYSRYGLQSFFIKQITDTSQVMHFMRGYSA